MKHKLYKGLVATAALTGCNSNSDDTNLTACEVAGEDCKRFTVIHTNDIHGRFWENSDGEYGMAARKTVIDQIRSEVESRGSETILLSGGDINTGVPDSDMQDAEPDFVGMNLLGYDAMAIGNHEYDNPLSVLDWQTKLADFPTLAANIYYKDSEMRYFEPYRVFEINGLKVAIIGFTTVDTPKIVPPETVAPLTFTDPQQELPKVLAEIEEYLTAIAVKKSGGYPQLNRVAMDVNCTDGSVAITPLGGRTFEAAENYTFSVIHFSAAGGDDYPVINQHPNYIDTQLSDAAVFREYFVANPLIKADDYIPVDGLLNFYRKGAAVNSYAE